MKFSVISGTQNISKRLKTQVFLTWDNWNDYNYFTLFGLKYVDNESNLHDIGSLKIGFLGQKEKDRVLNIGDSFTSLEPNYFSVGTDNDYYSNLNTLGQEIRKEILKSLKDIAFDKKLYSVAIKEKVTKTSLLRFVTIKSITGQFRRLANGGAKLTKYSFYYTGKKTNDLSNKLVLSFDVSPESTPPTNINVIIGRNGAGKTQLLNNMISSLLDDDSNSKPKGEFISSELLVSPDTLFANLISISFSAFDETEVRQERNNKLSGLQYSYIGLKRPPNTNEKNSVPKSTTILRNEFYKSLNNCRISKKHSKWKKAIEILESDPNFNEVNISSLIDIDSEVEFKILSNESFKELSSGHKIVLLIITRLIEVLEEKSLVIIDEPESHLHPPLLSAFIRALSEILTDSNGVAIIATHSPVVLQEVPRSCVWNLRRSGNTSVVERPLIETFGENVGVLTNEVFGLEVTNSGYYTILNEMIKDLDTYESILAEFSEQIGMEARGILMSILAQKNN